MKKYKLKDTKHYASEMAKATKEKLWFLDHIWVENLVDIGTADAHLPVQMNKMFNHPFTALCYEPNKNLFWEAQQKTRDLSNITVYNSYEAFETSLEECNKNTHVTLISSVLHELYSHPNDERLIAFWNLVRRADSKNIAIRDMCFLGEIVGPNRRLSDGEVYQFSQNFGTNRETPQHITGSIIKNKPDLIESYTRNGRNISNFKDSIEFLLKHRYHINWEHEVRERYLDVDWKNVDYILRLYGYEKTFQRYFTPPWIANDIKLTFQLEPNTYPTTHCELIYTKL